MTYIGDLHKNQRNISIHGIAFEDAARIFDRPTVEQVDDRFDYGEIRIYAVGVVWPQRKETVTIRLDVDLLAWL
jgi:uncharacterized protein